MYKPEDKNGHHTSGKIVKSYKYHTFHYQYKYKDKKLRNKLTTNPQEK